MSFQLNNSAECLGYLCLFVAYNDGEIHEEEVKRTMGAMAQMIKQMDIDVDGDGDVDVDDLSAAFNNAVSQYPDDFETAAKHVVGICCDYFANWSDNNKSIIVDVLKSVAEADGVIADSERANVNVIAECLGLAKPF